MTDNKTRKAKVRATGAIVTVYRLKRGQQWCNAIDCTTEYHENDLQFLD